MTFPNPEELPLDVPTKSCCNAGPGRPLALGTFLKLLALSSFSNFLSLSVLHSLLSTWQLSTLYAHGSMMFRLIH